MLIQSKDSQIDYKNIIKMYPFKKGDSFLSENKTLILCNLRMHSKGSGEGRRRWRCGNELFVSPTSLGEIILSWLFSFASSSFLRWLAAIWCCGSFPLTLIKKFETQKLCIFDRNLLFNQLHRSIHRRPRKSGDNIVWDSKKGNWKK